MAFRYAARPASSYPKKNSRRPNSPAKSRHSTSPLSLREPAFGARGVRWPLRCATALANQTRRIRSCLGAAQKEHDQVFLRACRNTSSKLHQALFARGISYKADLVPAFALGKSVLIELAGRSDERLTNEAVCSPSLGLKAARPLAASVGLSWGARLLHY